MYALLSHDLRDETNGNLLEYTYKALKKGLGSPVSDQSPLPQQQPIRAPSTMKLLIVCALAVGITAAPFPQGYRASGSGGGGRGRGSGGSGGGGGGAGGYKAMQCRSGEVKKADGSCGRPIVTRELYLYNAPKQEQSYGPPPSIPDPKIHYNFVFVRTPEQEGGIDPIVAPPPQQKTLVYVLSKKPDDQQQEVIEIPSTPTKPEVFYVAYEEGENPQLPGGVDLQTALSQSAQQGQVVDGGSGGGGGNGGYGGGASGGAGGSSGYAPPAPSSGYSA